MDKQLKEKLRTYTSSIFKQLNRKKMSPDEMLKSIKYEFYSSYPDEFEDKGKMYKWVLEHFREFFEKILYQKDEISTINNEIIVKDGKELTYGEIDELFGRGFFNGEIFHKINAELEKLEEDLETRPWVGVFHSQEHYEAFKHVLKSFLIEEHNKTLFVGFFREYGGNKILMRCNEKKWREWVNEHYLIKGEDSSKRWNECPQHHYTRKQIRQSQKTYKDPNIFKQPHARKSLLS